MDILQLIFTIFEILYYVLGFMSIDIPASWIGRRWDSQWSGMIFCSGMGSISGFYSIKIFPNSILHFKWLMFASVILMPFLLCWMVVKIHDLLKSKRPSINLVNHVSWIYSFGLLFNIIRLILVL